MPHGGAVGPAQGAPQALDPRDVRVDSIAEKILAELRTSPESVREIFRKPEQTIHSLRDTCRDLTRRERDVRRFLSPEEDSRLAREHDALQRRVTVEVDEVVKSRLEAALVALESQRAQRTELARSAARFEAEHTRISYTMESLYTQVVRMRSADAGSIDVAGAGLRRSLDLLSQEVNALADALERVNVGAEPKARSEADKLARFADGPVVARPGVEQPGPSAAPRREKV
jgi:chromosome segregation ATPase